MALPADLLERIPESLRASGMVRLAAGTSNLEQAQGLSPAQGIEESADWKQRLLAGELTQGGVLELVVEGGAALGTTICLRAIKRAQEQTRKTQGESAWCAVVDPTRTLYSPGVRSSGVDLQRLLIVRPEEEALSRVTLRLVESKMFPVVAVDLMGVPGLPLEINLGAWVRVVRRLSLALQGTTQTVVLLTDKNARRPLPLPVAERLELSHSSVHELSVLPTKWAKPGIARGARHFQIPWKSFSPSEESVLLSPQRVAGVS